MPIRVLAPDIANKIAAGEVVERPASVVKELVENAIDAGASEIRVEAREGGRRLIRIRDDGCGIPADETELAFARHATSKLSSASDLDAIRTLGFRGEALSSVAAVSRLTMATRARHEATGTSIRLEGGQIIGREARGMPAGTTVTVEHLFFNTPARLKFMRTTATEAGHIQDVVTRYALAFPARRFSLVSEGRLVFQSTGSGDLADVVAKVYGLEVARQLLPVGTLEPEVTRDVVTTDPTNGGSLVHDRREPSVAGFVGVPSLHRSNRGYISLYVNRRWIQDRSLSYAVIQAYHTLLPTGRFPVAVLFLDISPEDVDVNVHPTKAEVRFRDARAAFHAVQKAVRRVLVEHAPVARVTLEPASWTSPNWHRRQMLTETGQDSHQTAGVVDRASVRQGGRGFAGVEAALPVLRVLGQLGSTYVLAEGPGGLYLIDQHAAHERVLYEQLLAAHQDQGVPSQGLLQPQTIEPGPLHAAVIKEHLGLLCEMGIELEMFGAGAYLLRGLPAVLSGSDPSDTLLDIVDGLQQNREVLSEKKEEALMRLICKRAAIKAGQTLSMQEMQELVRQLEQTASPRTCPHGRPTMVHMSAEQLAREFGRPQQQ